MLVACIALLANFVLGAYSLHWNHAAPIGIRILLLAGTMGLLLFLSAFSADATHAHHLRHLKRFGIAALAVGCSFFLWDRETDAPPPVYNYHGERSFSVKYPEGWKPRLVYPKEERQNALDPIYQGRGFVFFFASGEKSSLSVFGMGRTPNGAQYLNDIIIGGEQFPRTKIEYEPTQDDSWDKFETTLKNSKTTADIHFIVWHLDVHSSEWYLNSDWYVIGTSNVKVLDRVRPKLEAARGTFTLTERTVPKPNNRRLILGIWAGIALLAAGWMWLRRSSAQPAVMLLLAVAGVALGLNAAGDFLGEDSLAPYGETFYCAQMVFAAASAIVLFWLFRKTPELRDKIIHLLLALNLAFLLAYAFSAAYGFGSAAGERHDAMKGIVILLALSWEIATSGELTNYGTRSFPRNSRVLLFLGYVMLVAFGVMTMFPTTYRITQRMLGFDSEQWVLRGILMVGIPFLMMVFCSRIAHLLWHKQPEASAKLSAAAVEPEGGVAEPA